MFQCLNIQQSDMPELFECIATNYQFSGETMPTSLKDLLFFESEHILGKILKNEHDEMIGYCIYRDSLYDNDLSYSCPIVDISSAARFMTIGIVPEYRGRGLASTMIQSVVFEASKNHDYMMALPNRHDILTEKLLTAVGFFNYAPAENNSRAHEPLLMILKNYNRKCFASNM